MLINLLPWRQSRNKRRQRQIVQFITAITVCHVVIGVYIVLAHLERSQRLLQQSMAVQQQLRSAAQNQQSLRQSYELQLANVQGLQAVILRWQQNADLQALLFKWGSLGTSIDVRRVSWSDNGLQLFGEADNAGAIRAVKNLFGAKAQNQQIELSSGGKYQFVISSEPVAVVIAGGAR